MTTTIHTTMLDVVQAVSEYAASDAEVVATVAYLINSGRVLLCGTFAGARIDLTIPPSEPKALFSGAALPDGLLPLLNSQTTTAQRRQDRRLPYPAERRTRATA